VFEHGGADQRIKRMVFDTSMPDPLLQRAGLRAGILSSAIGIAGTPASTPAARAD